ncbi:predicted ABC-type metal ion transport system, periplasmic component/surface antigen [Alteracholeplasma palmae J233]|uniref:Predicted ABC-type metal ion transport system, periplasmic component/surface antigen n=1 Tax=Alteracholeplasma palmae (strain ATCC 49389 / J233) TaxID=1318466 RepID=U4KKA1_ALTPJ|nr:MetQ/NlpA family ABC transporter substrate-binding protein [Alteracholeplasma palmae]CCV64124.1 predicted ABC-type metal ion transport system, periplasmic component/surface antigen [Alteracholeplasma palmae J233]
MKKVLSVIFTAVFAVLLVACNKDSKENTLTIGVDFYPMGDLIELIKDDLKKDGIKVEVKKMGYAAQNKLLQDKDLDANMIQHKFFMEDFNKANNAKLVKVMPIYYSNFSLYSKNYKTIAEVPNGTDIIIPSDSANITRSIYLLSQAGLLNLEGLNPLEVTLDQVKASSTINHKGLTFTIHSIVTAPTLYNEDQRNSLAIMYPTYIKASKLDLEKEILFGEELDDTSKEFGISLVAREDNRNSNKIQLLEKHLKSDKVRQFLIDNYAWASTPAF